MIDKEYIKKYRLLNKERINELHKLYVLNHPEQRLETQKQYRETHRAYQKIYYLQHKDKLARQNKLRYEKNKEQIVKQHKEYMSKQRQSNFLVRILESLRSRVGAALKGLNKSAHTMQLVGCSIDELKLHLQSHFKSGMTWDNYGKWHIDHIKPCCKFDLSKPEEQLKCFNWKNLRPLWAKENIKKAGNYD